MAPRLPLTVHLVAALLILNTYASVLPPHRPNVDGIAARSPDQNGAMTHDAEEMSDVANEKKNGKEIFKELGHLLGDFDPVDAFRNLLGGLLGFKDDATTTLTSSSSSLSTTTTTIARTPIQIGVSTRGSSSSLPTARTTVTEKITTTQTQRSSTKPSSSKSTSKSSSRISSVVESAEQIFHILPFFPTIEPLELTGLAPTALPTPHHVIFTPGAPVSSTIVVEVSTNATIALNTTSTGSTVTYEPDETFSVLPFIRPGEHLSDNVTFPVPTGAPVAVRPFTALSLSNEPFTSEEIFSILPAFPTGGGISDNVQPPTAPPIPPLQTPSVITAPVTDVPGATLLPVNTEEKMSILPFLEPGQHLSDNVTVPDITEVPILPIPIFTPPAESFGVLEGEESVVPEDSFPSPTDALDIDRAPVPLLELVDGTYVVPTTREPEFVTPVPIWTPKRKSSRQRRSTRLPFPSVSTPRATKLITLPPPLIRPTNFPLNETYFPNQTTGVASPITTRSSRPLVLTNPLRPTPELLPGPVPRPFPLLPFPRPLHFPRPIFNKTRGIRPLEHSTRPLVLTNPLRTTPEVAPTIKPIFNDTSSVRSLRPLILTNPLRPSVTTSVSSHSTRTTTKTLKVRSTTIKTVIVIPTPETEPEPEISIAGVDIPVDGPLPSDAGFVRPESFFPDLDEPGRFNNAPRASSLPLLDDAFDFGVPSDLVESTIAFTLSDPSPTMTTGTTVSLPTPSLTWEDIFETPEETSEVPIDPLFDALPDPLFSKATPSVDPDIDGALATDYKFNPLIPGGVDPTLELDPDGDLPAAFDLDTTPPLSTPTPTPRTFATLASSKPTPALPSDFPLPKPAIDASNATFSPSHRLSEICRDAKVSTVTLPLLQKWYGPNAYPLLRSYPGCVAPNARQAVQAPGLLNCTALGREVQSCQKAGKRVLLGIRVDAPAAVNGNLKWGSADPGNLGLKLPRPLPPGPYLGRPGHPYAPYEFNLTTVKVDGESVAAPNLFDALHTPTGLAATLFSLFGEGHAERADLRPLGPDAPSDYSPDSIKWVVKPLGEEVVLDGFDVRTPGQWKGTPQAALVESFVGVLRDSVKKAWEQGGGKKGGLNDLGVDGPGVVVSGYI